MYNISWSRNKHEDENRPRGCYQRTPALLKKGESKTVQRFMHCPHASQGGFSTVLWFHMHVNIYKEI